QQRGGDDQQGNRRAQAVPRGDVRRDGPSGGSFRPYTVYRDSNRYGSGFNVRGSVRFAPRVLDRRAFIIGGSRFSRPYYSFRPRLSLGFGLSIGYPVSYPFYETPYVYGNTYPYGSAYPSDPYYGTNAPYYDSQNYGSTYNDSPYDDNSSTSGQQPGGLSFTISPVNAAVFVDGVYVGTANEFGADAQPLGLVPGKHRVEIRANGYQTMSFDADVVAGQVVPYQATMRR
ncbi:MAG: PEGA domain-containing protein, partial [Acidobacteriota bacterium]